MHPDKVTIHFKDGADGWVTATIAEEPAAISQGRTREDARCNVLDALRDLGARVAGMHPATEAILEFFNYEHLPEPLRAISKPFCDLAHDLVLVHALDGPELTVALRKLLEAKDCAVRAAL